MALAVINDPLMRRTVQNSRALIKGGAPRHVITTEFDPEKAENTPAAIFTDGQRRRGHEITGCH